jgi:hypothetical protein
VSLFFSPFRTAQRVKTASSVSLTRAEKKGVSNEKAMLPIVEQSVIRKIIFDMGICGGTLRVSRYTTQYVAQSTRRFGNKDNRTELAIASPR